ncbi:glycerophosphoryl diester phosphodiesterase, putative [Babesia bigemina]|uniref:Glycerophosphoryl diester phosphodiesterase, putative n=1 Tax=Babesia bigemina TaxID=5866 RepID=A0A061D6B7_BABBI|nr:glycerophosphoryl diester phosphodiesterase, putative [Babesia bigemina]CDR94474.1 glycerophosphoryl diester phosphodiesterase, putative [Babesia bigemina]|eukprot:XP_012766660.1 glycerophosphoryl diester phosphodiesterase, putative [Babesia bigemina]
MSRVLTIGHRGMGCSIPGTLALYPENALSSFREALRLGVQGVELDVFLSCNNELLVIHGHHAKASLCLTALRRDASSGAQRFGLEETVEKCDIRASDLLLRKPWRVLNQDESVESVLEKHRSDVDASFQSYMEKMDVWEGEYVPTLEQVFQEFGDKLIYNIELKGTRPEIGEHVLNLVERYPQIKVIISSLNWLPPELSPDSPYGEYDIERLPNGKVPADLLRPLINNRLGLPIGLLFNNERSDLPSIGRILECAKTFGAQWIIVAHDIWKSALPIVGCAKTGIETLHHLVSEMRSNGLKLMTYFLESQPDAPEDLRLHVEAGVDAICPNDIEVALDIIKKSCTSKN